MNPCGDFGNVFPLQVNQIAPEGIQLYQLFWTLGMLAFVIAFAGYRWIRFKDSVLMAAMGAGFIAFFNEGNLEFLVHVTQSANGRWPVFYEYGMPLPAFELTGYAAVFPLVAYIAYRYLIKGNGISTRGFWILFAAIAISDLLMEVPAVSQAHPLYKYQQPQVLSLMNFPLYNIWINSVSWVLGGVLLYWFEPVLKGWKRPLISLLPAFAMCIGWGILDVPIVCALNIKNMPVYGQYLLTLLSLSLSLLIIWALSSIVSTDSKLRWVLPWPLLKKEHTEMAAQRAYVLTH